MDSKTSGAWCELLAQGYIHHLPEPPHGWAIEIMRQYPPAQPIPVPSYMDPTADDYDPWRVMVERMAAQK